MQRFTSLDQWLAWLETLHPVEIDLGLERIRQVANTLELELLTQPRHDTALPKIINVAGTNGKGTFVAVCEQYLLQEHKTVGAYTSPHLLKYNERIRVNGKPVDDGEICRAFECINQARGDISLTYFEFATLAALLIFNEYQVQYWLLEVGLGGRLDAVNLVHPDLAVITSIDLDHQNWLGNTREKIAAEKAGICRDDAPVICAEPDPPENMASLLRGPAFWLGKDFLCEQRGTKLAIQLVGAANSSHGELCVQTELVPASVAGVVQAVAMLGFQPSENTLAQALKQAYLPARSQRLVLANKVEIILDVAHNPAASRRLAETLAARAEKRRYRGVVAIMADKDLEQILAPMTAVLQYWYLLDLKNVPRAAKPSQLEGLLAAMGVTETECINDASFLLEQPVEENHQPQAITYVVFGSFFTVAEVMKSLDLEV